MKIQRIPILKKKKYHMKILITKKKNQTNPLKETVSEGKSKNNDKPKKTNTQKIMYLMENLITMINRRKKMFKKRKYLKVKLRTLKNLIMPIL